MEIVKLPTKILKQKLVQVPLSEIKNGAHTALIDQMHAQMLAANGVGLAANQVGQNFAFFIIDKKLAQEHAVPDVFFNPEITEYSKDTDEIEEGCLSIPEYYILIRRAKKIMFKAVGPDGKKIKFRARGFLARVLQHETDHLNGLTINNRAK